MESIITQSFGINLRVMRAFGLYPPESSTRLYKLQAYLKYAAFTLPIPILGSLYFILDKDFSMSKVDDNAFLIAEMGCQITKLLPFISNGHRVKKCINRFASPYFTVFRDNQRLMVDKCVRICRRNSTIFLISVIGGNIFWATKPFFGKKYQLPVDVWLPFDATAGSAVYFSTYAFLAIGVAYASIACSAIDPLIGGLACLASGQLQVLKDNLQHLSEYADEDILTSDKNPAERGAKLEIIGLKIKQCIRYHAAILSFVNEYGQCFSSAVFSQFLGSILVICFCCLQLSKVEPFSFNFFSMLSFLSTFLAEIYIYCYYGTILFEESNTLTNAIYMGKWYEYDVKSRKDLIILMERSKRPMIVTAGKVLDLSVVTFTMILRRSYSLLAVLRSQ